MDAGGRPGVDGNRSNGATGLDDLGVSKDQSKRWQKAAAAESESSGAPSPLFHLGPVPDGPPLELRDWLREIGVPPAPVMNDLVAAHAQSFRDL
jgi:hypothetical protein